jgi:TPR repeat protein
MTDPDMSAVFRAAEQGDGEAACSLGALLLQHGQAGAAEPWLRRAAQSWHDAAASRTALD